MQEQWQDDSEPEIREEDAPEESPEEAAKAQARRERLERERDHLLADIGARLTDDLKQRVGYILNHYPDARDSDVTLAVRLWKTFHAEDIEGDYVRLNRLYRLPRVPSIVRNR